MAFFSVLIPVYNQVGKMDKCIDSINSQTFTDFEVIMVDDGSTDESYEMLCGFAEKDSRIKVLRQEQNSSLVGARYAGMKNASGEYIVLLDSDDYMGKNMLETLYNRIQETQPDILRFGFCDEPEHEEISPAPADDVLEALFSRKITPSIWKNVYKRTVTDKLVKNTEPFYCNMAEDVYFSVVFFTFAEKIDRIDDILYYHEMDTGMSSMTNSDAISMGKLRRSMKDTNASSEHISAFLEKFAPGRLEAAQRYTKSVEGYVFMQHAFQETDYKKIIEYAYEYKRQGFDETYDMICNDLLKTKVLLDEGVMYMKDLKLHRREIVKDE